jgi:hypothetical protein
LSLALGVPPGPAHPESSMVSPSRLAALAFTSLALFALAASSSAGPTAGDDPDENSLHREYGFERVIVSKFNDGLFGALAIDVDGDGNGDLAVINNSKAKIEFLLHRKEGESLEDEDLELVNELPDEVWFRRESLAIEQRVWALAMADMDGDGRADAVFTGDSGKLSVTYAGEDLDWDRSVRFDIEDGVSNRESVRVGDLNGDGRPDVVVMTSETTDLFVQDDSGRLRAGARLPNATSGADGFDLTDLDGDGLLDLLYVSSESEWPLRYRFGQPEAGFGPEMRSRFSEIRSYQALDLEEDGRTEVVVVGRRSGRATVLSLAEPEQEAGSLAVSALRLVRFANMKDAAKRDVVVADLDRDGFPDVIVSEPSAARLSVYHGAAGGQFLSAVAWPSLLGSSFPRVSDLDDDGLLDIVLGAPDENSVGRARVDADGRIGFPQTMGAPGGDLLGLDLGDVSGDGHDEIWVVVGDGRGRSRDRSLRRLGEGEDLVVELDVDADPTDLALIDINRDGRCDVLVFVPTELPSVLLAQEDGRFQVLDEKTPGLGILKGIAADALFFGDVDGDGSLELLVPGSNFARAIYIADDGSCAVVAQYNLEDASADVGAVAAAQLDGRGAPELLLVDKTRQRLMILGQEGERVSTLASVDLAGFQPVGIIPADIDRDGQADLLLWDKERFASVQVGGRDVRMTAGDTYESPVKDAYLDSIASGDVNGDGVADLIFTETSKHLMHIVAVQADGLQHALKFPVFESRMFESSRRSSREPREVIVADFTGDDLIDIAILVHDRVIVYPQEPAP